MNENNQPELKPLSEEELAALGGPQDEYSPMVNRLLATITAEQSYRAQREEQLKKALVRIHDLESIDSLRAPVLGEWENEIDRILQLSTYQMRKLAIGELVSSLQQDKDTLEKAVRGAEITAKNWQTACNNLRTQLDEAKKDKERLLGAATALINKCDEIHNDEHYLSVWQCYQNHGGDYSNGPKYVDELNVLRLAIDSAMERSEGK